jgi:hypothetical protein
MPFLQWHGTLPYCTVIERCGSNANWSTRAVSVSGKIGGSDQTNAARVDAQRKTETGPDASQALRASESPPVVANPTAHDNCVDLKLHPPQPEPASIVHTHTNAILHLIKRSSRRSQQTLPSFELSRVY